jgi:hypothetical protein
MAKTVLNQQDAVNKMRMLAVRIHRLTVIMAHYCVKYTNLLGVQLRGLANLIRLFILVLNALFSRGRFTTVIKIIYKT